MRLVQITPCAPYLSEQLMIPVALMSSSLKPFVMRRSSVRVRSEAPALMSTIDISPRESPQLSGFSRGEKADKKSSFSRYFRLTFVDWRDSNSCKHRRIDINAMDIATWSANPYHEISSGRLSTSMDTKTVSHI